MPKFSPDVDDITIYPSEFMDACHSNEIKEVIEWLVDNEKIKVEGHNPNHNIGVTESIFQEHLEAIRNNYHRLTVEEEETIIKIAKKF